MPCSWLPTSAGLTIIPCAAPNALSARPLTMRLRTDSIPPPETNCAISSVGCCCRSACTSSCARLRNSAVPTDCLPTSATDVLVIPLPDELRPVTSPAANASAISTRIANVTMSPTLELIIRRRKLSMKDAVLLNGARFRVQSQTGQRREGGEEKRRERESDATQVGGRKLEDEWHARGPCRARCDRCRG